MNEPALKILKLIKAQFSNSLFMSEDFTKLISEINSRLIYDISGRLDEITNKHKAEENKKKRLFLLKVIPANIFITALIIIFFNIYLGFFVCAILFLFIFQHYYQIVALQEFDTDTNISLSKKLSNPNFTKYLIEHQENQEIFFILFIKAQFELKMQNLDQDEYVNIISKKYNNLIIDDLVNKLIEKLNDELISEFQLIWELIHNYGLYNQFQIAASNLIDQIISNTKPVRKF